jgi:predicted Rossmann fold nucleotide-binding protein DprA/Smf involved in DNA uptake
MNNGRELLSDDGAVVAMLCSHLGLRDGDQLEVSPLTLKEWNTLSRKINESKVKSPNVLLGLNPDDLTEALGLEQAEAIRIVQLLARRGAMGLALDDLAAAGIWCVTRADEAYPNRLRSTLKHQAPPVLFGAGELETLSKSAIAVVGSRNLDEPAAAFARDLGRLCAEQSISVVSGGARGTDRIAMEGALAAGGKAVGVLADSLQKLIRQPDVREFIMNGQLVLLTPYQPDNGFSIGAAMGRNKVIYGCADFAVVVSSEHQKGGTWSGAVENLQAKWCPSFVRSADDVPAGNRELINKGAQPLPADLLDELGDLSAWMKANARALPQQGQLLPV